MIPLPVRESELLDFTPQEWAILDGGMETFDLPSDRVAEVFALKAAHPKLSANDCFCLVTTRCHQDAILLTGDSLLHRVASGDGRHVHGVLWVVDELSVLRSVAMIQSGPHSNSGKVMLPCFFLLPKSNAGCDPFGVHRSALASAMVRPCAKQAPRSGTHAR